MKTPTPRLASGKPQKRKKAKPFVVHSAAAKVQRAAPGRENAGPTSGLWAARGAAPRSWDPRRGSAGTAAGLSGCRSVPGPAAGGLASRDRRAFRCPEGGEAAAPEERHALAWKPGGTRREEAGGRVWKWRLGGPAAAPGRFQAAGRAAEARAGGRGTGSGGQARGRHSTGRLAPRGSLRRFGQREQPVLRGPPKGLGTDARRGRLHAAAATFTGDAPGWSNATTWALLGLRAARGKESREHRTAGQRPGWRGQRPGRKAWG